MSKELEFVWVDYEGALRMVVKGSAILRAYNLEETSVYDIEDPSFDIDMSWYGFHSLEQAQLAAEAKYRELKEKGLI